MPVLRHLAVFLLLLTSLPAQQTRLWTDASGRSFEGQYITADLDLVKIRRESDGKVYKIPLSSLGEADRNWVYHELGFEPLKIDGREYGGAFAGKIDALWGEKNGQVTIIVQRWDIRFRCGDQEGRGLRGVCFELAADKDGWSTGIRTRIHPVDQYIRYGDPIVLENLSFMMPIKDWDKDNVWFVATYFNDGGGVNFDHPDTFPFTGKPRR